MCVVFRVSVGKMFFHFVPILCNFLIQMNNTFAVGERRVPKGTSVAMCPQQWHLSAPRLGSVYLVWATPHVQDQTSSEWGGVLDRQREGVGGKDSPWT